MIAYLPCSHGLTRQDNIYLFVFIFGIWDDNTSTFSLLLKFEDFICWLSDFSMNNFLSLIQYCLAEKSSSCGFDGKLCIVLGHKMRNIALIGIGMQEEIIRECS